MELHRLPLPPLGANCYLLKNGPEGLVIDPGGDADTVVLACKDLELAPAAILLTHGHFDHVGAVADLCRHFPGLPVYCHPGDVRREPGEFTWAETDAWRPLRDGQVLALAGLSVQVLHTPGHSPGSCCFRVGEDVFTGDTLFRFSMGRTDLPGGDMGQMRASLTRLAGLEGDLALYPGHDAPTTLDHERLHNPYLQGLGL